MHADTLYHRMLDQEEHIKAAKAEGQPVPSFPPLLSSSKVASLQKFSSKAAPEGGYQPADLPPNVQERLKKRLVGLEGKERELEEQAIIAELRAGEEAATNLANLYKKQEEESKMRKEQGRETMVEKVASTFGLR
jgi:hypothetical protein